MQTITEPSREIPIIAEADVCVIGGSCTGVFAAVRAARLGARVVLIEKQNCFGGMATAGLVHVWHSLYDTKYQLQIISGLTEELLIRLEAIDALEYTPKTRNAYKFNSEELKIELDNMVLEHNIKPFLQTLYTNVIVDKNQVKAIIVETKEGRRAIRSQVFIDASGDGDLCRDLDILEKPRKHLQPPTTCVKLFGAHTIQHSEWEKYFIEHGNKYNLCRDWGWNAKIPHIPSVTFHAETHIFGVDCSLVDQLTQAEIEGRKHIRSIMDIIRKYHPGGDAIALVDLASSIGIRETRHAKTRYSIAEKDILYGKKYSDAIANGTYGVDIHHTDRAGVTMRYLSGVEETLYERGVQKRTGRWAPETYQGATYYQIPYRALLPEQFQNVLICGRMIQADPGAFGAIRVMVNLNQTGEAAGVAAYLATKYNNNCGTVPPDLLRSVLQKGGSIVL